jgi:ABC-type sugar transport system permease subunit
VVAPVVVSIFYSFTYYNILETPKFIGLRNYINLLLGDDVFLTAIKNTLPAQGYCRADLAGLLTALANGGV